MIRRWLMTLFRRLTPMQPSRNQSRNHDVEEIQREQVRIESDELYRRLAEREVEHRAKLVAAGVKREAFQRGLSGIGRGGEEA